MAFEDLLIDTCTVLEDVGAVTNGYGTKTPDWDPVAGLSDISCRLMATGGREVVVGAEVVVADYKLFVEDIDITEQNRVRIDGIDYEVLMVADRQDSFGNHHKECLMRAVR